MFYNPPFSSSSQISVLPEKLLPRDTDEDLGGGHVDDMTKLTYLNEPGVLYNLKRRYALNEIYVSSSPTMFLFDGKTCHVNLAPAKFIEIKTEIYPVLKI
jgi:hypothetical protein